MRRLLSRCFPHRLGFRWRRHLGAPPDLRWVLMEEGEALAHVALYERLLLTDEGPLRAGGIGQVCVAPERRGRGMARALLEAVHHRLEGEGVPFAFLFGAPRLYEPFGYRRAFNRLRATNALFGWWNPFRSPLLVRPLAKARWPEGQICLNGPTI